MDPTAGKAPLTATQPRLPFPSFGQPLTGQTLAAPQTAAAPQAAAGVSGLASARPQGTPAGAAQGASHALQQANPASAAGKPAAAMQQAARPNPTPAAAPAQDPALQCEATKYRNVVYRKADSMFLAVINLSPTGEKVSLAATLSWFSSRSSDSRPISCCLTCRHNIQVDTA